MFVFCLALASGTAFAGFGTQEDSVYEGEAGQINASTNLDSSVSGNVQTLAVSAAPTFTGDVTFQSSLIAGGRYGASSSIPSSSNGINPSTLPYSLLLKSVGNVAGETATLPNGTSGQFLKIQVVGCGPAGTWIVSRTKGSGWTTMTFNGRGDEAFLLYDSTLGWIILSSTSVTVADTAL